MALTCDLQLSMWDFRMKRKVLNFRGHVNEYKNCKSVVDRLEAFVTAVGSDGTVRIWSTRTGALMHSLHRTTETPHIAYSETLGGAGGTPALLVTGSNSITLYQL